MTEKPKILIREEINAEFDQVRDKRLNVPQNSIFDSSYFKKQPLIGIAILGYSWQTAAKTTMWMKPQKLYLLAPVEILQAKISITDKKNCPDIKEETAYELIVHHSGLTHNHVIQSQLPPDADELEVYSRVETITREEPNAFFYIDLTGGKKCISLAATLAAYLNGIPVIYIDYDEFDTINNTPKKGTEYPRTLINPLENLGVLAYKKIIEHFNRGNFAVACELAEQLQGRLYENRPAEFLLKLSAGYEAWEREDFRNAKDYLQHALKLYRSFGQKWPWGKSLHEVLEAQIPLLASLSRLDKTSLKRASDDTDLHEALNLYILNVYFQAIRAHQSNQSENAVIKAYACVEHYVRITLMLNHRIDFDAPKLDHLNNEMLRKFNDFGSEWMGKDKYVDHERFPDKQLYFQSGLQLLGVLSHELLPKSCRGPLKGLGNARNNAIHGFLKQINLQIIALDKYLNTLKEILLINKNIQTLYDDHADKFILPTIDVKE